MAHLPPPSYYLWRISLHSLTNYGAPPSTLWLTMAHLPPPSYYLWRTSLHPLTIYGAPISTL